jgi:lipopolysaccharide/colanic/teichoic acid biosynthesis glycosyltransferase
MSAELPACHRGARGLSRSVKVVMDVTIAGLSLVLLAPVLVCISLLVRLDSPGPALFRQQRVGKGGRLFSILKFRSMVAAQQPGTPNVCATGDPRVTHVGRFLRRYYLDELPQLINVAKGDMSLVGPRPETPEFVALYTDEERQVLTVRPGLVGPSTLAFMDEGERLAASPDPVSCYADILLHERAELDRSYLSASCVRYDVVLLVRQARAIVRSCHPGGTRRDAQRPRRGVGLVTALPVGGILVLSLGVDVVPDRGGSTTDFLAHAVAYGLLTVALIAVGPPLLRRSTMSVLIGVTALGALLELLQLAVGRDAQWIDVIADVSGGVLAALALLLRRRSRLRVGRMPTTSIDA